MRMYLGYGPLSFALVLVLLLLVAPAIPSRAAPNDDGAETAAPDAGIAGDTAPVDSTPEAAAAAPPVVFDPYFCVPIEGGDSSRATPAPAASPVAAKDPAMWDFTEGVPADSIAFWLLVDTVTAFLACSNADASDAALTMVTDAYLWKVSSPSALASPAATTVPERSWLSFTDVDAVRMHGSDRAVVFILMQDPGYCDWDVYLAVALQQVDGVWLVDGFADVSEAEPVEYTPPVFRAANAPVCRAGE